MRKYMMPEIEIHRFHIDTFLFTSPSNAGTGGSEGGETPDFGGMYSDVNSHMEEEEELRYLLDL
ncbi:MAG: hypothetical protein Q4C95_10815 [Planctomycetia bacterium]|nr:hypothetical protein [Planctomycetia bacterium]